MTLPGPPSVATTRSRVLVVDDFPDSAETASILLALHGYDCRIAVTGQGALDQAAVFEPSIVILDIGLPDMSGYEVARALRARPGGRWLYLAAVTGRSQPQDRTQALAAGFDHHVIKPTSSVTLLAILQLAADRAAAHRAL